MDVMEYTRKLREERMNLFEQGNAVYADAKLRPEGQRALTGEEQAKVDRLDARIAEIDAEVRTTDEAERRAREGAAFRDAHERQFGTDQSERKNRSLADEFRSWAQGAERRGDVRVEGEVSRNAWQINLAGAHAYAELRRQGAEGDELRSLLYDTGSSGSLVPTLLDNTIYEYLTAGIAAYRMPTTKLNTASGAPMDFPTVATHGIGSQVKAQGTAIAGTDPTFGKITLNSYKVGELLQIATETIADNGVNLMDFIGRNIARAVAQEADRLLVAGTGSSQPQGMTTAATVGRAGTVATGGTLPAGTLPPIPYEALVDMVYGVNDQYRQREAAWLMRDATAGQLRKLRSDGAGTIGPVLWEPSLTNGIQNGQPDRLLGFSVYTDPNVASLASDAKVIFFGDWSAYYIRTTGGFVLERSDEYAFNTDLVTFRGKTRVDGDFVDLTAVVTGHNAVT